MTKEEFENLTARDYVRHKGSGRGYMITNDYGNRKIAVTTIEITNPDEWELVDINQLSNQMTKDIL
jgi:hypothetical protein